MKSLTILTSVLLTLFASGCSNTKTLASQDNKHSTPLYETKWTLKKIYTEEGTRDISTNAFIRFDKEKNSAGGNGSCNSFGSSATINGNEVNFKNIFSTKMYCDEVQSLEDLFFRELGNITRYEIKNNKLLLFQQNKLLLEFQAA